MLPFPPARLSNKENELAAQLNPALQADSEAVGTWVYPTNYPVRQYQVDIVHQALFRNTLVSLPTGLGKTLIAAVVMYNYFRWFPNGKIVFMAPTKPLVAQQVTACYGIMGIPEECTAELQGNIPPARRQALWQERRVFYCTPQSLANDIKTGACNPSSFVLVVVDEAHRATGNYAFTTVIREISRFTDNFRVLALSATPGVDKASIQKVISNLRINHIEARSEEDPDVQPYVFDKQVEAIKCKLGSHIERIKRDLLELTRMFMFNLLKRNILLTRDPDKLHQFQLIQLQSELKAMFQNCRLTKSEHGELEGELALLISLAHAKKLLVANGAGALRQYLVSVQEEAEDSGPGSKAKAIMLKSPRYRALLEFLHRTVEDEQRMSTRHPKIVKLKEILTEHFERHTQAGSSTKCIIFTQFRDSVQEIVSELEDVPLVSAMPFVGQGNGRSSSSSSLKGQKQHEQVAVLEAFNRGDFNVLVATCIGEEGLDIAEVDIIISFDALSSPTRMVQRMGRTGRKRAGRVIMLATEGVEEHKLMKSHSSAQHIVKLLREGWRQFRMFQLNPRMIPDGMNPTVDMRCMEIEACQLSQIGGRKRTTASSSSTRSSRSKGEETDNKESKRQRDAGESGGVEAAGNAKKSAAGRKRQRSEEAKPLRRIDNFLHDIEFTPDAPQPPPPASSRATQQPQPEDVFTWTDVVGDASVGPANAAPQAQKGPDEQEYWYCGCGNKYRSTRKTCRVCSRPVDRFLSLSDNTPVSAAGDMVVVSDETPATSEEPARARVPLNLDAVLNCAEYDELLATLGVAKHWRFQTTQHPHVATSARPAAQQQQQEFAVFEDYPLPSRPFKEVSLVSPCVAQRCGLKVPERQHNRVTKQPEGAAVAAVEACGLSTAAAVLEQTPPAVAGMAFVFVEGQPKAPASDSSSPNAPAFQLPAFDWEEEEEEDGAVEANDQVDRAAAPPIVTASTTATRMAPSFAVVDMSSDDDSDSDSDTGNHAAQAVLAAQESQQAAHAGSSPPASAAAAAAAAPALFGWEDYDDPDLIAEFVNPQPARAFRSPPAHTPTMSTKTTAATTTRTPTSAARSSVSPTPFLMTRGDSQAGGVWTYTAPSSLPEPSNNVARTPLQATPAQQARLQGSPAGDDSQACEVCGESDADEDNPIVYCDGICRTAVHMACYGLSVLPEGNFFCEGCELYRSRHVKPTCALCDTKGGLMKRTTCNKWAHLTCTLWTAELTVDEQIRPNNIEALDSDRKQLMCAVCSGRGGACVQCAAPNCWTAMHPQCAKNAGRPLTVSENCDGELEYDLYCIRHEHYAKERPCYSRRARDSPASSQSASEIEFQSQSPDFIQQAAPSPPQVAAEGQRPRKRHRPINRAQSPQPQTPATTPKAPNNHNHRTDKTPGSGRGGMSLTQLLGEECAEKPTPAKYASRKLLRQGQKTKLKLPPSPQENEDEEEEEARKPKPDPKAKQKPAMQAVAAKFFSEEAELSGSASEDESDSGDEEAVTESQRMFINDAPTPNGRDSISEQEMYLQVNRDLMDSPDLPVFGFRGGDRGLYYCARAMQQHAIDGTPDPTPTPSSEDDDSDDDEDDGDDDDDHEDENDNGRKKAARAASRPTSTAQEPWERLTGKPRWKDIDRPPSKPTRVLNDISNAGKPSGPSFDWVLSDSDDG